MRISLLTDSLPTLNSHTLRTLKSAEPPQSHTFVPLIEPRASKYAASDTLRHFAKLSLLLRAIVLERPEQVGHFTYSAVFDAKALHLDVQVLEVNGFVLH